MSPNLDAEEQLLADSVSGILARACTPEDRSRFDGESWSETAWSALGDAGAIELCVMPPSRLPLRSAAVVAMEVGRSGVPVPLATAAAGATLLDQCQHPAATEQAAKVADGSAVVIPLWPQDGAPAGIYSVVPYAVAADAFLADGEGDISLFDARDLDVRPQSALGPEPVGRVEIPHAAPSVTLPTAEGSVRAWHRARMADAFVTAATAAGAAATAVRYAVDYVQSRKQFGVSIASFQAVQHQLADAAIDVELALQLVFAEQADEVGAERRVVRAERLALAAYRRAATTACHVMGGYGFTLEFDAQRHFRASRSAELRGVTSIGTADELFELAADAELLRLVQLEGSVPND